MWISTLVGLLCLVGAAFLSLSLGTVRLSFAQTLDALLRPGQAEPTVSAVIWSIRFPRIVVAMLVGAALAVVGAVMQAILRNPQAEPGITGVSGGAAVGAVAGITFGLGGTSQWGIPLAAFAGAAVVSLVL